MHSLDFQAKVVQSKGWLLCSYVWLWSMIYGMGVWTNSARCDGCVPCFSQDGNQAQVLHHPIDSCRYNTMWHLPGFECTLWKILNKIYFTNQSFNFRDTAIRQWNRRQYSRDSKINVVIWIIWIIFLVEAKLLFNLQRITDLTKVQLKAIKCSLQLL